MIPRLIIDALAAFGSTIWAEDEISPNIRPAAAWGCAASLHESGLRQQPALLTLFARLYLAALADEA